MKFDISDNISPAHGKRLLLQKSCWQQLPITNKKFATLFGNIKEFYWYKNIMPITDQPTVIQKSG